MKEKHPNPKKGFFSAMWLLGPTQLLTKVFNLFAERDKSPLVKIWLRVMSGFHSYSKQLRCNKKNGQNASKNTNDLLWRREL